MAEIPAMIDLARELGARVLNFSSWSAPAGENLTDITPEQYEKILTSLARIQGLGNAEGEVSTRNHRPSINPKIRGPFPLGAQEG